MNNKTLIMGVGNPILKDDGVGIHAVRELRKTVSGVDYLEESFSGLELI
jgi:hydrogenase maturation protease